MIVTITLRRIICGVTVTLNVSEELMNVPVALHKYAKVVNVTSRRLLISVKIIPKDNVHITCYSTKDDSGAYPLYYKGELIN